MTERKLTGRATSIPQGLALGALISIAITILVTAMGAHMIASEIMPQEQIGYCSIAAILLSTVSGGMIATGRIKRRRLMVCMLSGLCYFCILLSMTALFFGGQYDGIGVTLLIIILGSLVSALITNRQRRNSNHRQRKKTIR